MNFTEHARISITSQFIRVYYQIPDHKSIAQYTISLSVLTYISVTYLAVVQTPKSLEPRQIIIYLRVHADVFFV